MNAKLLDTIERMHQGVKEGGLEIETNLGFIGPDGIKTTDGEKIENHSQPDKDPAEELHDFIESIFGGDDDDDTELIPPKELTDTLDAYAEKNFHAVGIMYDAIREVSNTHDVAGNLYTMGHALTKITEAMVHDMIERLDVTQSPEMAKYALIGNSVLSEIMPIISKIHNAEDKKEQVSAVNQFLILLGEQLMGVQTTLAFFDKLVDKMGEKKKQEEDNSNE